MSPDELLRGIVSIPERVLEALKRICQLPLWCSCHVSIPERVLEALKQEKYQEICLQMGIWFQSLKGF